MRKKFTCNRNFPETNLVEAPAPRQGVASIAEVNLDAILTTTTHSPDNITTITHSPHKVTTKQKEFHSVQNTFLRASDWSSATRRYLTPKHRYSLVFRAFLRPASLYGGVFAL
ncbi:hypothetical protein Bbelb_174720 [Branchiostoma belcheri]|nr:hypothetical protein Bbelb_174720 [Branchiostoma belcheri]